MKKKQIPDTYRVIVRKENRIVDGVFSILLLGIAGYFCWRYLHTSKPPLQELFMNIIAIPILVYLALWHYPHYIFEFLEVNKDEIIVHRLYRFKKVTCFGDIQDAYIDRKENGRVDPSNASKAIMLVFPFGKYRLPTKFCECGEVFRQDLKRHGIAIR